MGVDVYSFDSRIRYSECDETGRLSPLSMMNYLQDCSTFQSQELGIGIEGLTGQSLAWVLASWTIEVDELPPFGTDVTVSTWCYAMTRAHALRCFQIADAHGRPIVRADSQWFVFDVERRRATRVPESQLVYVGDERRLDMAPLARRIRVEGPGRAAPEHVVAHADLDTNHHVNNARYVRIALDALEALGCEAPAAPLTLQVQYRSMALLGDVVRPRVHPCAGGWNVDLADAAGGTYAVVRIQARQEGQQ